MSILTPLPYSPLQTCTMAEKRSRWSSPRLLHVPTAAGWATQRCPCRSMWLQSTQRPPQKWYVVALSFTQRHVWNFVRTAINNRTHLDLCCLTSEEVIFLFFLEHALHCYISFTVLLHIVTALCCQLKVLESNCAALFIDLHCCSFEGKKKDAGFSWVGKKMDPHPKLNSHQFSSDGKCSFIIWCCWTLKLKLSCQGIVWYFLRGELLQACSFFNEKPLVK